MDRRSLLALFRRPLATTLTAGSRPLAPSPEAVYDAARQIRGRIDAALAASLQEFPTRTRR
jgi:hypothetical protein